MEPALIPCPRCGRHVQAETHCPFCRRRGRLVLVTAVALAVAGAVAVSVAYTTLYGGPPAPTEPPKTPGGTP